jgi:hypothetical protein
MFSDSSSPRTGVVVNRAPLSKANSSHHTSTTDAVGFNKLATKYPSENSLDTINDFNKKLNTHSVKSMKNKSAIIHTNKPTVTATNTNESNKEEYSFTNAKLELLEPATLSSGSSAAGKSSQPHLNSVGSNETRKKRQDRRSRSCSFGSEPELHIEGVIREVGIDADYEEAFESDSIDEHKPVANKNEKSNENNNNKAGSDENNQSHATGNGRYKKNNNRNCRKSGGIKTTNVIIVDVNEKNETIKVNRIFVSSFVF